jgi:FtsH-binding integral membrane protein
VNSFLKQVQRAITSSPFHPSAGSGLALVTLSLLVLAGAWKLTLGDRIIARGDLLLYFYPLRDFAAQALREGRLPLWNPYTFMGSPFLANSQAGFFYPLNMVMAWLPVERAVSWSIALHLLIAALGAYALARKGFTLSRLASFATAIAFGLGGYLGAQVEHLNQLQVLAWLPLLLLMAMRIATGLRDTTRALLLNALALAGIVALMITAGHTQSLYIALVAAGVVFLTQLFLQPQMNADERRWSKSNIRVYLRLPVFFVLAVLLAVAVCAVQLLPTLELSRESARAGGLSFGEAASFSWRPWLIARALLPTYGDPLFAEYVAYLGVAGLALALLGGLQILNFEFWILNRRDSDAIQNSKLRIQNHQLLIPLLLVLAGFILALGVVTPLFNVLYRFLPGFNLFRAQARWLILFAMGAALLIGFGVQRLQNGLSEKQARTWLVAWVVLMGVWLIGLVAGARISLDPEYRSLPAQPVLMGWLVAAVVVSAIVIGCWLLAKFASARLANSQQPIALLFAALLVMELLLASQFQPYSRAADRQALTSLRPSVAHLLADAPTPLPQGEGRVLALSSLFFDPGDKIEQEMIYGQQLSADEVYDRIIASKHKEVLSPNLPLYFRLPSVDGYDGGLLPTRHYAEFVKQFAQTPAGGVDGRLREFLKGVPADPWLDQMAVRSLIADKTQDVFIAGVYYDLLFSRPITGSVAISLAPFASTSLGLVLSAANASAGDAVATATVQFDDGSAQTFDVRATEPVSPAFHTVLAWDGRKTPVDLNLTGLTPSLRAGLSGLALRGLTSIDATDNSFLSQFVLGSDAMRLTHSGDVKLYERLNAAPRAVFSAGDATITASLPEQVIVQVNARAAGTLILRDTCFPGWVAQIDGGTVPIECADTMFRAVQVPAGAHTIVFSYQPQSVQIGAAASIAGVALFLAVLLFAATKTPQGF